MDFMSFCENVSASKKRNFDFFFKNSFNMCYLMLLPIQNTIPGVVSPLIRELDRKWLIFGRFLMIFDVFLGILNFSQSVHLAPGKYQKMKFRLFSHWDSKSLAI